MPLPYISFTFCRQYTFEPSRIPRHSWVFCTDLKIFADLAQTFESSYGSQSLGYRRVLLVTSITTRIHDIERCFGFPSQGYFSKCLSGSPMMRSSIAGMKSRTVFLMFSSCMQFFIRVWIESVSRFAFFRPTADAAKHMFVNNSFDLQKNLNFPDVNCCRCPIQFRNMIRSSQKDLSRPANGSAVVVLIIIATLNLFDQATMTTNCFMCSEVLHN